MLDNKKLEQDEWDDMLEDIRVLEAAALDAMQEKTVQEKTDAP